MSELFLVPSANAAEFYSSKKLDTDNAGYDLFVPNDVTFAPDERKLVSMEVRAVVIEGEALQNYWMVPRSSISKTGLIMLNSVGVIDKSYRGELMAFLWNTKDTPVTVSKGDRLVQIVAPDMGWISQVEIVEELDSTERGSGGFGSSGR
jgi:dUTP pyrophosphatase